MSGESLLGHIVGRVDTSQVAQRMVSLFRSEIDAYKRLPESVVRGQILAISERNVELFFRTLVEDRELSEEELVPFRESARHRASEGLTGLRPSAPGDMLLITLALKQKSLAGVPDDVEAAL